MPATLAGGGAARVAVDNGRGRMTAGIGHHQILVRLDDKEPCTHGKQGDDDDDGNDYGLDGPTRMPACIKYVSGIHGLSLSVDRYPRFFPL